MTINPTLLGELLLCQLGQERRDLEHPARELLNPVAGQIREALARSTQGPRDPGHRIREVGWEAVAHKGQPIEELTRRRIRYCPAKPSFHVDDDRLGGGGPEQGIELLVAECPAATAKIIAGSADDGRMTAAGEVDQTGRPGDEL